MFLLFLLSLYHCDELSPGPSATVHPELLSPEQLAGQ